MKRYLVIHCPNQNVYQTSDGMDVNAKLKANWTFAIDTLTECCVRYNPAKDSFETAVIPDNP